MAHKQKHTLIFLLKCTISVSLLFFILTRIDWTKAWATLASTHLEYFGLAMLILAAQFLVSAYKWQLLLRVQSIRKSLQKLHTIYYIGYFFNNLLPTTIGGDAVRIYRVSHNLESAVGVTASVIVERITGLAAMIIMAVGAFAINVRRHNELSMELLTLVLGLLLVGAITVILAFKYAQNGNPSNNRMLAQIQKTLTKLVGALGAYRGETRTMVHVIMLSFVFHAMLVGLIFSIGRALQLPMDALSLFYIVPIVGLVSMIPISINGLGLREWAYVVLLQQMGLGFEGASLVAFVARILSVVPGAIGGIAYLVTDRTLSSVDVAETLE